MADLATLLKADRPQTLAGVPEGFDALVLGDLAQAAQSRLGAVPLLHIAREDRRISELTEQIAFFAPEIEVIALPAWDCLPYDRVSPNGEIMARRMAALTRLATTKPSGPRIVLTTISAALQRVPARDFVTSQSFCAKPGDSIDISALTAFLTKGGYSRSSQVTEPGEFAQRGGLIDIFPPDARSPIRLDLFGDELDQLRCFDPLSQRTTGKLDRIDLRPVGEFALDETAIRRFRKTYVETFGAVTDSDPLYEAISEGRRYQGAEHWLPLFHDRMETLFDYLPDALVSLDHQASEAATQRIESICDYYETRKEATKAKVKTALSSPYKPLMPGTLYLDHDEWDDLLGERAARTFSPFAAPSSDIVVNFDGKVGRNFAPERQNRDINIYDALRTYVSGLLKDKKRVVLATYSDGARQRMQTVLADHKLHKTAPAQNWDEARALPKQTVALAVMALEHGFDTPDLAVVTEQDILGDRLIRKGRKARRGDDFLRDASALSPGNLVVHVDHGVGRFEGLETIEVSGAPHDCVALTYRDGDKLFVPVENIDVLSRYGSEGTDNELDKLGGHAWQAKKARMKKRIRDMAEG